MYFLKGVIKVDVNTKAHSVIHRLDSDSAGSSFIVPLEQRVLNPPELLSEGFLRDTAECCSVGSSASPLPGAGA